VATTRHVCVRHIRELPYLQTRQSLEQQQQALHIHIAEIQKSEAVYYQALQAKDAAQAAWDKDISYISV
jgi:hypothetical protein